MSPVNPALVAARRRRLERLEQQMGQAGVEAALFSLGADLPWLIGYEAMPLERLTMLVVVPGRTPVLVVPQLEAPRVDAAGGNFELRPWAEGSDPVAVVARLVGEARRVAVSDRTWAVFLMALQQRLPGRDWLPSSQITAPLRSVKDPAEIQALSLASEAADRVAQALLEGQIPLVGRSEREVSAHLGRLLLEAGHDRVNFAIVGSGPNSASPHHEAGGRVIGEGEPVVCDFGGTMAGYCSDTTRTVWTGSPSAEATRLYEVLEAAQAEAVAAVRPGVPAESIDATARAMIASAGFGEAFIHRTGHGIGLEEHEHPYIVAGNTEPLVPGHAFSVEPGIYLAGRFGARIEDIVVVGEQGPIALNRTSHGLTVVRS